MDESGKTTFATAAVVILITVALLSSLSYYMNQQEVRRSGMVTREKIMSSKAGDETESLLDFVQTEMIKVTVHDKFLSEEEVDLNSSLWNYLGRNYPKESGDYLIRTRGVSASYSAPDMNTMDIYPARGHGGRGEVGDPRVDRAGELREGKASPYFRIFLKGTMEVEDTRYGTSLSFPVCDERTIDTPYPFLLEKFRGLERMVVGDDSHVGRCMRYILTTLTQYRIVQGWGHLVDEDMDAYLASTGAYEDLLSHGDIEIALNLALILELLQTFRGLDPSVYEDFDAYSGLMMEEGIGDLIKGWAARGTVDPADVAALLYEYDEPGLDTAAVLSQSLYAVIDLFLLRFLDYFGLGEHFESIMDGVQGLGNWVIETGEEIEKWGKDTLKAATKFCENPYKGIKDFSPSRQGLDMEEYFIRTAADFTDHKLAINGINGTLFHRPVGDTPLDADDEPGYPVKKTDKEFSSYVAWREKESYNGSYNLTVYNVTLSPKSGGGIELRYRPQNISGLDLADDEVASFYMNIFSSIIANSTEQTEEGRDTRFDVNDLNLGKKAAKAIEQSVKRFVIAVTDHLFGPESGFTNYPLGEIDPGDNVSLMSTMNQTIARALKEFKQGLEPGSELRSRIDGEVLESLSDQGFLDAWNESFHRLMEVVVANLDALVKEDQVQYAKECVIGQLVELEWWQALLVETTVDTISNTTDMEIDFIRADPPSGQEIKTRALSNFISSKGNELKIGSRTFASDTLGQFIEEEVVAWAEQGYEDVKWYYLYNHDLDQIEGDVKDSIGPGFLGEWWDIAGLDRRSGGWKPGSFAWDVVKGITEGCEEGIGGIEEGFDGLSDHMEDMVDAFGQGLTSAQRLSNMEYRYPIPSSSYFKFWNGNGSALNCSQASFTASMDPGYLRRGEEVEIEKKIGKGKHYTSLGRRTEQPFNNWWDVKVKGSFCLMVESNQKEMFVDGRWLPARIKQNVTIDLSMRIHTSSGWPLEAVDYDATDTAHEDFFKAMNKFFDQAWKWIKEHGGPVFEAIQMIIELFSNIMGTIMKYFSEAVKMIGEMFTWIIDQIKQHIMSLLDKGLDKLKEAMEKICGDDGRFEMNFMGVELVLSSNSMVLESGGKVPLWIKIGGEISGVGYNVKIMPVKWEGEVTALVETNIKLFGLKIHGSIEPLMIIQEHIFEGTVLCANKKGNGWKMEIFAPHMGPSGETLNYELKVTPVPIPIPPLGMQATANVGMTIVYDNPIENNVVINEFEFPFSVFDEINDAIIEDWDGTQPVSEMFTGPELSVELYNPMDEEVTLSQWELENLRGGKRSMTLSGTVEPGEFYTVTVPPTFYGSILEQVRLGKLPIGDGLMLRDGAGDIVDRTDFLFPHTEEGESWQRDYDGGILWVQKGSTIGSSNGEPETLDIKKMVKGMLISTFTDTLDELEESSASGLSYVYEFVQLYLENFKEKMLDFIRLAAIEAEFYLELIFSSLGAVGDSGINLKLSFVMKGGEYIADLVEWIIDTIVTFLDNIGNPTAARAYPTLSQDVIEHMYVRLDLGFSLDSTPDYTTSFLDPGGGDEGENQLKIRIEANIPAIGAICFQNWGRWRVNFGLVIKGPMAEAICKGIYGEERDELYIIYGSVYELRKWKYAVP